MTGDKRKDGWKTLSFSNAISFCKYAAYLYPSRCHRESPFLCLDEITAFVWVPATVLLKNSCFIIVCVYEAYFPSSLILAYAITSF